MSCFNSRLKQRRIELGFSQIKLAKKVGMSQSGIALLENGRNQETSKIIKIAAALQTTPEWLLGDNSHNNHSVENLTEADFISTPKSPIGLKKAYLEEMECDETLIDFFIQVDDSMSPTIYFNDCVLVNKFYTKVEENKIFLIQRDNKKILRRIAISKDNNFLYKCDNSDKTRFADSYALNTDEVIGKVIWVAGKRD